MNGKGGQCIEGRLLPDRITIRKPVQSFVGDSKKPVFEFQVVGTGIPARFNPESTASQRTALGQTPKKRYLLFLNLIELLENYEIIKEDTGDIFIVTQAKNLFQHHLEVMAEVKKT